MEQEILTPVQIVQELIAIHTTRIEAAERLGENQPAEAAAALQKAKEQSKQFTKELMDELSNFGDAVQADAGRENEFQAVWSASLAGMDTMAAVKKADTFTLMENKLRSVYQEFLQPENGLPDSLQAIVIKQAAAL